MRSFFRLYFPLFIVGIICVLLFQNCVRSLEVLNINPDMSTADDNASNENDSTSANITIDASQSLGTFSPYLFGMAGNSTDKSIDLTASAGYKLAIVNTKKIGDGTTCDDSIITDSDTKIDNLLKNGIAPIPLFDPYKKPENLETYSACIKKVGKHFFEKGIKIFRFSNEPDGSWTEWGTNIDEQSNPTDVAQTYEAWANALKSVDQSIIVEGPAIMDITEKDKPNQIADWVKTFLNYCSKHDVPLDVFSFHVYSQYPYDFYRKFNLAKKELQKHTISPLYGTPKLGNDEWLMMLGDAWSGQYHEYFDKTWAATAQINGLINMIEEGAVLSIPTFGIDTEQDNLCHDFLPISCSGKAKPVFYAFQAFNQLANTNQLKTSGTDKMNFAVISGIKEINGDKQIIVIISNYDISTFQNTYPDSFTKDMVEEDTELLNAVKTAKVYKKFVLNIKNTPWESSKTIAIKRYLIDDNNALVLMNENDRTINVAEDKSISLDAEISAPQIQIITLSLKDNSFLFSMEPALAADENYGKRDSLSKEK